MSNQDDADDYAGLPASVRAQIVHEILAHCQHCGVPLAAGDATIHYPDCPLAKP